MDSPWRVPAYGEQLDCIAALLRQVIWELQLIRETLGGRAGD